MANNLTLSVTLTGDGRQLSGTLRNAQGEVQAFGGSTVREGDRAERSLANVERRAGTVGRELQVLTRLAAPLGAAFAGMFAGRAIQSQIDYADRLQKTNLRIGASVEALSQYNHVAGLSGVAFEQLTTGWQRQTRRISEAAQGYGTATDALDTLGLSAEALNQLAPEEQFERIAEALQGVESQADRTALAMKLWDTEGVGLLQIVNQGTDAMRAMREEADRLGLTISQDTADAMANYNDEMARFQAVATGVTRQVASELVPAMTTGLQTASEWLDQMGGAAEILDTVKDAGTGVAVVMAGRYVGAIATSQAALAAKTAVVATTTGAINLLTGATTRQAAAATAMAGATRVAAGALALIGGPLGAAVIAGSAIYYFRDELGLTGDATYQTTLDVDGLTSSFHLLTKAQQENRRASIVGDLIEMRLEAGRLGNELVEVSRLVRQSGQLTPEGGALPIATAEDIARGRELRHELNQLLANIEGGTEILSQYDQIMEELGETTRKTETSTRTLADTNAVATKAAADQANALEALRNRLVPNRRETVALAQDQNTLNLAFAMGRITASEYLYMIGALQTAYIEAQNDADDLATSTTNALYTMEGAMEELRTNGLRRLDDGFADLWQGAIDGSLNASEIMKRVLSQTLAELAHMAITRPITVQLATSMGMGGGGVGGMGGVGGIGGLSPSSMGSALNALRGGVGGIQWMGAGGAQAYGGAGWANAATSGTGATGFMGGSMQNFSGMQGLASMGAGFAGNWLGSQMFGQGKHSSTLGTIGGAVGTYFGGPLGALAGSTIGSALGGIFGGSWETKDAGLNLGISSGDITGNQYENQRKSGGWFSSSKSRTRTSALNSELEAMLQDAYAAQEASLAVTLETLGQQSSALNAFSSGLTRISTKGLDEAEVEQAVQKWLQNVVNSAAQSVTDPSQYARAGETTVDTLSRLATALNGINPILEQLHENSLAASLAGGDAASHLAELAGGIDAFSARADFYYQNVLTEAERQERAMNAAARAMGTFTARTGRVIESTDALRELVDGIDLTTGSGRELYNQAMNLAPALVEIERGLERVGQQFEQMLADASAVVSDAESQVRQAWQTFDRQSFSQQIELLNLMGDAEGALALERERELATIDEALRPMRERIWAMQDEAEAQQRATQAAQGYIRELTRVRDQLSQQLGSIGNWLDQQMATSSTPQVNLATAQEQFARQLVRAENGDRDALQSITQYAQQVLDANRDYNASSPAGQRIEQDVFDALKDLPKALSDAEFIVEGFRGIVTDEMAAEIERAIFASQYTIDALIDFAADASALPQDLRTILGEQAHRLDSTLNYLLGENQLDSELRQLALASSNNLVATVDYIARSQLSNRDKLLALSSSNTMTALIDYVVGTDIDRDSRVLALEESNRYSAIVNMLLGRDISADDRRLALESVNGFTAVVDYVIRSPLTGGDRRLALSAGQQYEALIGYYVNKDISKNDRTLALNSANRYLANVEFIVGRDISSSDRRLALNSNNRYVSTIDQLIGKQVTGGDRRLALNSTNAYLTTVDAVLKRGISADVRTFGLANSNAIMTTVDGILASGMSGDVRTLALKSSNRFVTTLEAALKDGRITGDERKLLDARSADVIKTLKTSGSLNLTQDEWAVINAASGTQRLQLLADVAFGRTDLDKLDNIDDNTKPLAEQARDQLKELNGLVSEMTRSTDQFVGLNSTMVSLRESINALGVANAERARIERERAAAEQAERDRIERERKQSELAAQRSSLQNQIGDYQGRIASLQSAASGVNVSTASIEGARDWRYGAQHIQSAAQTYINAHGVSQSAADRFLAYFTTGAGSQERSGRYAPGGQFFSYIDAYAKEIANTAGARGTIAELNNQIAELQRELKSLPSVNGSHRTGLEYVPFDGYLAELHRGEKVLTAEDADAMRNITIARPAPLPNYPLLGNSDIVETLRDLKREVAELRRDNARLQGESNQHLAAANNQRGAAATQQIAATERGNRMLKKLEDDKRLEAAKR